MAWYLWLNWFILVYFLLINGTYILMNILAFFSIREYYHFLNVAELRSIYRTRFTKPISILVPAYNEERTILSNIKCLLKLDYPQYELIIINDGSKDSTMEILKEELNLYIVPQAIKRQLESESIRNVYQSHSYPQIKVVDKENGGKADALNAGLNVAAYPLFCSVDSDSLLEKDALMRVVRPFVEDPRTIAVGGVVRIANDCRVVDGQIDEIKIPKNHWARFQVVEYLRAFLFGRIGWDAFKGLFVISGAFGLFKKDIVIASGGFTVDTVGEDMELVVKLHRYMLERKQDYKITFVPDPVCWTEVPEEPGILAEQRARWQRGLAQTLWKHKKMCLNPNYGWIGFVVYPYFLVFEFLGPVIEVVGILFFLWSLLFGLINWPFAILFFIVAIVLGIILSLSAIVLEELFFHRYGGWRELMILCAYGVAENFYFRQANTVWRVRGLVQFLFRNRSWGQMTRKGISTSSDI